MTCRDSAEEQFLQALLIAGLIKEIKPPRREPIGERRLIETQGEPLSEIMIKERR